VIIVVKRWAAFGDVLLTTPVLHRLRQENRDATIIIESNYPDVFVGNRDIDNAVRSYRGHCDKVINLDGSYERRLRRTPTLHAYMSDAFGDDGGSWQLRLGRARLPSALDGIPWDCAVAVNPARSWPQRTIAKEWWDELCHELRFCGLVPISVGTTQDWELSSDAYDTTRMSLSVQEQAELISRCLCYVGSETGAINLAQCTSTPIVALFTMGRKEQISVDRGGVRDRDFHVIPANVPCVGCSGELTEPTTWFTCRFGTNACIAAFDAKHVVEYACSVIDKRRQRLRLKDVTLVIADTVCHDLMRMAVDDSIKAVEFGDVIVASNRNIGIDGAQQVIIDSLNDKTDYSRFIWDTVPNLVSTSHFLVVQWDGFVVNPLAWNDAFMFYDYIGAPWWHNDDRNVGNGGFSLRSTRLSKHLLEHCERYPFHLAEDHVLCREYSDSLRSEGFRFADEETARGFSFEMIDPNMPTFGFHHVRNFPLVLAHDRLAERMKLVCGNEYIRQRTDMIQQFDLVWPGLRSGIGVG
jgi:hypothetical protein